jgi:hypothetical protein
MYLCLESVIARHDFYEFGAGVSLLLMPAIVCAQCSFDRFGGRTYWFLHS